MRTKAWKTLGKPSKQLRHDESPFPPRAGQRLIAGAQEALSVAKGEVAAARITIHGHAYVPEVRITAAQEDALIQMALHDIEDKRGPMRESIMVFREFYRSMKARVAAHGKVL